MLKCRLNIFSIFTFYFIFHKIRLQIKLNTKIIFMNEGNLESKTKSIESVYN